MATHNSDGNADMNWLVDINVFMSAKSNTNWTTNTVDSAGINNARRVSSGAQNDEIAWDVVLGAGTWTVELVHRKGSDLGIYSVQIDSVEEGTIDGFNGTPVENVQDSVTGIVIDESGLHELKLKMATKNGSASNYYGAILHIQLRRTA